MAVVELEKYKRSAYLPPVDHDKEYAHSGMVDWLSLKCDLSNFPEHIIERLRLKMPERMCKIAVNFNEETGEFDTDVLWENFAWDTIASDTHQVCCRVGTCLYIQGSPARVGLPNNTFGALDIVYCAQKMIDFAAFHYGLDYIPPVEKWDCTRIDVTRNFIMESEHQARQALESLKLTPSAMGKRKHSTEEFGFYINKKSSFLGGKIYLKGQDAARNMRFKKAHYTESQLEQARKILRAELKIARHKINRLSEHGERWFELTPDRLLSLHEQFFIDYLSSAEVTAMGTLLENLEKKSPTKGQAAAAYDCYTRIKMMGFDQAKASYTKRSWYRHMSNLKNAGVTKSQLTSSNVVPLQRKAINIYEPVRHWDDIKMA